LKCSCLRKPGDGHRFLVTPERALNEYNEDLKFDFVCLLVLFHLYPPVT